MGCLPVGVQEATPGPALSLLGHVRCKADVVGVVVSHVSVTAPIVALPNPAPTSHTNRAQNYRPPPNGRCPLKKAMPKSFTNRVESFTSSLASSIAKTDFRVRGGGCSGSKAAKGSLAVGSASIKLKVDNPKGREELEAPAQDPRVLDSPDSVAPAAGLSAERVERSSAEHAPFDARPPSARTAVEAEAVEKPLEAAPVAEDEIVVPSSAISPSRTAPSTAPGGMPLEMHQALSALDERLIAVLRSGDIRLVRASWLLAQPDGFHMPYRQELEALEASGVTPSPLLSPDEAVAIIKKGDRSACILS